MFVSDIMQILRKMGWAKRITMRRLGGVLPIVVVIQFANVFT